MGESRDSKRKLLLVAPLVLFLGAAADHVLAVCGDGVPDGGEDCDLGGSNGTPGTCCTSSCSFTPPSNVCRASMGPCDVADTCTGSSAFCPADVFAPPMTVCRGAAGICDVAENCTGSSPACPTNGFQPSSFVCRASAGVCDTVEACTGSSATCPPDGLAPPSTVCRPPAGPCDVTENCTGSSLSCPTNGFQPSSFICRAAAGVCDTTEACTGSSANCPTDGFAPSTTVCRAAAGICDVAENCPGSSASCPTNGFQPSSFTCRPASDICDVAEDCPGSSSFCPMDVFVGSGTVCRPANDLCDLTEACTGTSRSCPNDLRVTCDDGDPCSIDTCEPQTGACQSTPTPDSETSRDGDGICHTTDDNLSLYGTDGMCGNTDDTTGDGVCDLLDKCGLAYDPGQEDSDRDGAGDACDATPCLARGLYAISGAVLYRFDPLVGNATFVASSFPGARDVAVDATESRLVVTSQSANTLWVVDLTTGTIANSISLSGPWGVDLGSSSGHAYIAERDSGRITRFDLFGGLQPVGSGLSSPTGIDVNASETTAYVTESGSGQVSSLNLTGGPGGPATLITSGLSNPLALALDPSETYLYVIEQGAGRLSRVSIGSGTATVVTGSLQNPQGIALDATGSVAYVTEQGAGFPRILSVNLSTGAVTPLTSCGPGSQCIPFNDGLALSPRPPVVLSLTDTAAGAPGSSVSVPVLLDDVNGLDVLSADLTVRFDPAVLSATGVGTGTITGGCTVTGNLTVPGRAVISVFCASPLIGGGSIASITFNVVGTRGQGTSLDVISALLNEGTPAVCANDGAFIVPVDIGGRVVYYRDHATSTEPSTKPVDGAAVTLSRHDVVAGIPVLTPISIVSTDCAGDYLHAGLTPVRSYRNTPSKTDDFAGAIDPFDAALNAQHVVGLITLTPGQQLAADVTGNRALTSFDSARIAQFSVGLITQFAVATQTGSDWTFLPSAQSEPNQSLVTPTLAGGREGYIEYLPIVESAENQGFRAILYGDVSGNWQGVCPPIGPGAPLSGRTTLDAEAGAVTGDRQALAGRLGSGSLTFPDIKARTGDVIQVPLRAAGTGSAISFLLDLRFDPKVLRLIRVDPGAQTSAFSLTSNLAEPGRARLALFHTQTMGGDGDIMVATFEVVGQPGSRSALSLAGQKVNEGGIAVKVKHGSVLVQSTRTPR